MDTVTLILNVFKFQFSGYNVYFPFIFANNCLEYRAAVGPLRTLFCLFLTFQRSEE